MLEHLVRWASILAKAAKQSPGTKRRNLMLAKGFLGW